MQWTRMADGSYYSVQRCYSEQRTFKVVRAYAGRGVKGTTWVLYVDDQYQQSPNAEGTTCTGAKAHAVQLCCRWRSNLLDQYTTKGG